MAYLKNPSDLKYGSGASLTENVTSFMQYGLGSAAVSAGLSIYNTAGELSNVFGNDFESLDTHSVLKNSGFDSAAEYYADNRGFVDGVGFIAGSFVPGGLAVKGLRAGQRALSSTARLSTGFRKVLIPQSATEVVETSLKQKGTLGAFADLQAARLPLLMNGMKQQALETAAFEGAVLLSMNQSPFLNTSLTDEDLTYFQGIQENLGSAIFGLGLGTVLGGGFQYVSDFGAAKRFFDTEALKRMQNYQVGGEGAALNYVKGDRVYNTFKSYFNSVAKRNSEEFQGPLDPGMLRDLERQERDSWTELTTLVSDLTNKNEYFTKQFLGMLKGYADAGEMQKGFDLLAGQRVIDAWHVKDAVFEVPVSSVRHVLEEDMQKYANALGLGDVSGNKGFMVEGGPATDMYALLENVDFIQGVARTRDFKDFDHIFTYRHETGHILGNWKSSDLAQSSALGARLNAQAEALSRQARAGWWKIHDDLKAKFDSGQTLTPTEMERMNYPTMVKELVADSWAMMNIPEFAEAARKAAPDLYKWMVGNNIMDAQLSGGKGVFSIHEKKLYDTNLVPTIADQGPTVDIVGKGNTASIQWGRPASRKSLPLATKYSADDLVSLGWENANALFTAAKSRTDIKAGAKIQKDDLPALTAAYAQGISVRIMDGALDVTTTFKGVEQALLYGKAELALALKRRSNEAQATNMMGSRPNVKHEDTMSAQEIGRIIDTGPSFVDKADLIKQAIDSGDSELLTNALKPADIPFWSARMSVNPMEPSYAVMRADPRAVKDGHRLTAEVDIQKRLDLQRQQADTVMAAYAGELFKSFPASTYQSGDNFAQQISPTTSSNNLLASANQEYMTGSATAQYIGRLWHTLFTNKKTKLNEDLDSLILKGQGDEATVYELSALYSKILQQPSGQGFRFMPETVEDFIAGLKDEPILENIEMLLADGTFQSLFQPGNHIWQREMYDLAVAAATRTMDTEQILEVTSALKSMMGKKSHTIQSDTLGSFLRNLVKHNTEELVDHKSSLAGISGRTHNIDPGEIYFGPIDTRLFPHHALVVPGNTGELMGAKHPGMVIARNSTELLSKVEEARAMFPGASIYTNKEIKKNKLAFDTYERGELFADAAMDSALKRKGIFYDVTPEPNAQIFNYIKAAYERQHANLTDAMIRVKYSEEIGTLERASDQIDMYNSTTGAMRKERNAYSDTLNMMLNRRPEDSKNAWNQLNTITDKWFSEAWGSLRSAVVQSTKTGDIDLMNKSLENYGMTAIYSPASELFLRNASATGSVLGKVTSKMNAFLGLSMLRADPTHGLMNILSLPIAMVPELQVLTKAAKAERVQVLRNGTSITVPGSEHAIPSNMPLMMQSMKDLFTKPHLIKEYEDAGVLNGTLRDFIMAHTDVAKQAGEVDIAKVDGVLTKALNVVTAPSDFSEQLVRFVSARTADLVAETLQIPKNQRLTTINTFVNRVNGNYLASQRPGLFQGWLGQSIGLFQTYQFNLMQNFLKYVGGGDKAAIAKMVGLQAGLFGAQSLPGFQLVNQHIGERSGTGSDFYSTTSGAMGDTASNWLMYGTASSATIPVVGAGIDLYSRGDLSPRTPIFIPTSPSEIPAVAITSSFVNSLLNGFNQLSNGAPVYETAVNALAHNGLNRPIQGAAQLMQGHRTTNQMGVLAFYEGWANWNGLTKVLGTKPLDEAVAVNSYYRSAAYESARNDKLNGLGQAFRATVLSGGFDADTYFDFMGRYTESGGKIDQFDRWVARNYKNSTEDQITQLRRQNDSIRGRYLQSVMGAEVDEQVGDYAGLGLSSGR